MPRQLKLKPEDTPLRSTLIRSLASIPTELTAAQRQVLRSAFDMRAGDFVFFHDSPELRRALQLRGNDAQ